MQAKYFILYAMLLLMILIFSKCYPTYQASKVNTDSLKAGTYSDIQAKVFKPDNTIILFPKGYVIRNSYIQGDGIVSNFGTGKLIRGQIKLPLDSIAAMTSYKETTKDVRNFGSFLLGITGVPLTILGVYCISCPKCCFGSCPTVYTYDGEKYNLEAELFSECISRQLENSDIDLLKQSPINDTLQLKITDEALETHYINKFEMVVAEHPAGTELYPAVNNKLLLVSAFIPPLSAVTKEGINIIKILKKDDNKYYRSGVKTVLELKKGSSLDWIDVKIPASKHKTVKMILKYRNTLLSTELLYDVVLGSQGIKAMEWTKEMNEEPGYAAQFKMLYDTFSGIQINLLENGNWKYCGKFKDAGPLNWKYIAAELPANNSDNQTIRLEFIPDDFMIDYIAFDTTSVNNDKIKTRVVYPFEIVDGSGNRVDTILRFIKYDDLNYLKNEPGDSYYLNYKIPAKSNFKETALIYSKGYYNEWIRGSWINNKDKDFTFNLYDIKSTLSRLADGWIENSSLLEREFFHSRFFLKEGK